MLGQGRAKNGAGCYRLRKRRRSYRSKTSGSEPREESGKETLRERQRPAPDAARGNLDFQPEIIPIVGHGLRNPLAAITGSIALLRRQAGLTPLSIESLDRMTCGAAQMARLMADIADIVDFARTWTPDGLPLKLAPADLPALCEGVIAECRIARPQCRLVLETHGDGRGIWDAQRIEQALTNLIVNAIQQGGNEVVTVHAGGSAADLVELKVHNQGLPIPRAALSDLFKAHRRGHVKMDWGLKPSVKRGTEFVPQLPREAQKKGP